MMFVGLRPWRRVYNPSSSSMSITVMRPFGWHLCSMSRSLQMRCGDEQSWQRPVMAHGVLKPSCLATFRGAAMSRMRA